MAYSQKRQPISATKIVYFHICWKEIIITFSKKKKNLQDFFSHFLFLPLFAQSEREMIILYIYCGFFYYRFLYSSCVAASANLLSSWRGRGWSKSRSWLLFDEYGHIEAQIWDPLGGKLAQQIHSLATFTFCTTSCVSMDKRHSGTLGFEVLPQRQPLCTLTPKQELLLLL